MRRMRARKLRWFGKIQTSYFSIELHKIGKNPRATMFRLHMSLLCLTM